MRHAHAPACAPAGRGQSLIRRLAAGLRPLALAGLVLLAGCATRGPMLATLVSEDMPRRVELADVPFFPQDAFQCGPAALATVLNHAGAPVTPEALVPKVYLPERRGSLQAELMAATRSHERLPYILEPTTQDLLAQVAAGRPVLVLQNLGLDALPAWHFAVVAGYDAERNTLLLRSGTRERLEMDLRRFDRTWARAQRWAMVALMPGELPANADVERYMTAAAGLEATGRLEAAAEAYRAAQARWPRSAWPWLGLANVDYAGGRFVAAEVGYEAALERDPLNIVARNNLADLLATRGCIEAAHAHIVRAGELAAGTALAEAVAQTAGRIAELRNVRIDADVQEQCPAAP